MVLTAVALVKVTVPGPPPLFLVQGRPFTGTGFGLNPDLTNLMQRTTTARLTARFDPTNHTDERGTRVDFDGARAVERAAAFRATLAHFVGAPRR